MNLANKILDHLDGVRTTGRDRWIARCPAHSDKTPSLAIREADDRVLIHCFAGCSPHEIVTVVGLELGDLFPERVGNKPIPKPFPTTDIFYCLNVEVTFLSLCADKLAKGQELEESDRERLHLCASRFRAAMVAGGLS